MHTVTKVLVVFAAILCVLLAALTMAYSINAERITADYRTQVNARQVAESAARDMVAGAQTQLTAKEQEVDGLRNQVTALSTQIQSLESELAQRRLEVNQAKLAGDASAAQINQLATTGNTQAKLIDSYRGEVTKLRDNELAFRKRETELTDRVNDLDSQLEVSGANVRALQEQLAELRRTIDTGATQGTQTASGHFVPSIPISGKILQVGKANGKPIATINVGANNQVKENMQLAISRNGQFVANFIVTKADLQWAVGEINTLGRNVEVKEGDTVGTLVSR